MLFKDTIETSLSILYLTAAMLIVFALLLAAADRFGHMRLRLEQLSWRHGLLLGSAQALALIFGVSRSGGTFTAGLLMGAVVLALLHFEVLSAI